MSIFNTLSYCNSFSQFIERKINIKENNQGIRIGGELKGLINDRAPFLNLFLTKGINLSEIGKAIKSN